MKKNIKLLMLLIIGCILFTGCGKNEGVDEKITLNKPDNIKVETFYSIDESSLILKLTNTGNEDISDLDIYVKYPTTADNLLSEDEVFLKNFKANTTTYASLMLPINDKFEYYMPTKIDLDILTESENIEGIADTSEMVDFVNIDYTIDNNIIDFNITNDTGKILGSVSSIVVYFKDGKPIATDYIDALNVEETYNIEREILYSGDEEDSDSIEYIDYDNIEIYVTNITDDYTGSDEFEDNYDYTEDEVIDDETIDEDEDMSWDE